MTDHDLLVWLVLVSGTIQVGGLVVLALMLRESQRMVRESQRLTRAVAGLVMQETSKLMEKLVPGGRG